MNEFNQKDYAQSRSYADNIKSNADNIMSIFDNIDNTMKELYGENWQSSGADISEGRYQKLRKNYEVFYQNVINMHDHIYKVTASNETTDNQVSQTLSDI